MLCILFFAYMAIAEVVDLQRTGGNRVINDDNTYVESFAKKFSDKFSCFYDSSGVYRDFHLAFYGTQDCQTSTDEDGETTDCADHYCCGYMANGLRQCDKFD